MQIKNIVEGHQQGQAGVWSSYCYAYSAAWAEPQYGGMWLMGSHVSISVALRRHENEASQTGTDISLCSFVVIQSSPKKLASIAEKVKHSD